MTTTRTLLVCVECERAFEERDIEPLVREPSPTLVKKVKRIFTKYSHFVEDAHVDTDARLTDVVGIDHSGEVGICHFCLSEVYDYDAQPKRSVDEALEAASKLEGE